MCDHLCVHHSFCLDQMLDPPSGEEHWGDRSQRHCPERTINHAGGCLRLLLRSRKDEYQCCQEEEHQVREKQDTIHMF